MAPMVAEQPALRHRTLSEIPKPKQAKADLTKREEREMEADFRAEVGRAVQRAFSLVGWSVKEAADHIGRERAQVSRWIAGTERAQFDALFAVESLRKPLVIALAELTKDMGADVEVRTRIDL